MRYQPLERNKLLITATLLDPRFKKAYKCSPLHQAEAIAQLNQEIRKIAKQQGSISPTLESSPCKLAEGNHNSIWNKHTEKFKINLNEDLSTKEMQPELKLYFNSSLLTLSEEPIKFWHNYKTLSPSLCEAALKYSIMMESLQ